MDNKKLFINGFELVLDDEIIRILTDYLQLRSYIITLYSLTQDYLFIKNDGTPYITSQKGRNKSPDYNSFYKLMKKEVGTQAVDLLTARRIVQMIKKGIDIATISKLTSTAGDTLINLFEKYNQDEDANKKLNDFFYKELSNNQNISSEKKGIIRCSFCGDIHSIESENWLLAQLKENGEYYLACKGCGAKSGRIKY